MRSVHFSGKNLKGIRDEVSQSRNMHTITTNSRISTSAARMHHHTVFEDLALFGTRYNGEPINQSSTVSLCTR